MAGESPVRGCQRTFSIRRDSRSVREAIRRVRNSDGVATLRLFGSRMSQRALDYVDRRVWNRDCVRMPVYLVPVIFEGQHADPTDHSEPPMIAVTRDLSLRGIGFTHDEPLHGDHAIVTFDLLGDRPVSLLLDLRWRNLRRGSAYLSGGRFLAVSETPSF
jgi:hypothetical protein